MTDAIANVVGAQERWYDRVEALVDDKPKPKQNPEEIKSRILNGLNGGDEP